MSPGSVVRTDRPVPLRRLAARRLVVAVPAGALAGAVTGLFSAWQAAVLVGWIALGVVWSTWTWAVILRLDPAETSALAVAEEPNQGQTFALLLAAAVASLAAVAAGVVKAGGAHGPSRYLLLGAGIAAIVVSWLLVHTVFTLRYAALYYKGGTRGIDFHSDEDPVYADFAYLAFTIGMTFQVSDTDLRDRAVRHTALRHALLSYLFGTVIIAATVNVAAGLAG